MAAFAGLTVFLLQQRRAGERALLQAGVFASEPFPFAFLVSIVAGASLFAARSDPRLRGKRPGVLAARSRSAAASERLSATAAALTTRGMDIAAASAAARGLLARSLAQQSMVIAFNTAFLMLALLFVFAAPILLASKVAFAAAAKRRAARLRPSEAAP